MLRNWLIYFKLHILKAKPLFINEPCPKRPPSKDILLSAVFHFDQLFWTQCQENQLVKDNWIFDKAALINVQDCLSSSNFKNILNSIMWIFIDYIKHHQLFIYSLFTMHLPMCILFLLSEIYETLTLALTTEKNEIFSYALPFSLLWVV